MPSEAASLRVCPSNPFSAKKRTAASTISRSRSNGCKRLRADLLLLRSPDDFALLFMSGAILYLSRGNRNKSRSKRILRFRRAYALSRAKMSRNTRVIATCREN